MQDDRGAGPSLNGMSPYCAAPLHSTGVLSRQAAKLRGRRGAIHRKSRVQANCYYLNPYLILSYLGHPTRGARSLFRRRSCSRHRWGRPWLAQPLPLARWCPALQWCPALRCGSHPPPCACHHRQYQPHVAWCRPRGGMPWHTPSPLCRVSVPASSVYAARREGGGGVCRPHRGFVPDTKLGRVYARHCWGRVCRPRGVCVESGARRELTLHPRTPGWSPRGHA